LDVRGGPQSILNMCVPPDQAVKPNYHTMCHKFLLEKNLKTPNKVPKQAMHFLTILGVSMQQLIASDLTHRPQGRKASQRFRAFLQG